MQWLFRRLRDALGGIWYALLYDRSFQWQIIGIIALSLLLALFFWPLTQLELLFLGLAYALIVITELQNSAFEESMNRLHPQEHDAIRRGKDMTAGAVLAAGLFLLFVLAVLLTDRLF